MLKNRLSNNNALGIQGGSNERKSKLLILCRNEKCDKIMLKRMLLTGDLISAKEALSMGLVLGVHKDSELDEKVSKFVERIATIPKNQLMMQKLAINQMFHSMGLEQTQTLAVLFDGFARHSPEGFAFKKTAEKFGFKEAVKLRDTGDQTMYKDLKNKSKL